MSENIITAEIINLRKAEDPTVVVIDVLPEDAYSAAHIAEARNACVYEMSFLDQVAEAVPDKSAHVVVYGTSERSRASADAARKLSAAGYANVHDYRAGLEDWEAKGLPVEKNANADRGEPSADHPTHLSVDTVRSKIRWVGRNLANQHDGAIRLSEGALHFEDGELLGGSFTIDMNSMECTDIDDAGMAALLIKHLVSDDFFETEKHPEARFEIQSVAHDATAPRGSLNYRITGALTLKDVTREISFEASGGWAGEKEWAAQADFDFDRTDWNVLYGSGKFYEKLGMHLVNDLISLNLTIIGQAE